MSTHHSLRGVLLFMVGLFLFACLDATSKYLSQHYDVPLIVAVRYLGNLLLMVTLFGRTHWGEMVAVRRPRWVVARGLALCAGSIAMGFALQRMPLAETSSILFFAPVLVILASGPLLGERAGVPGFVAAAIGFAGVLCIVRPGGGLDPVGVACALAAMVATTTYQLLSRYLAATEKTLALLFYTTLAGSVIFGVFVPWYLGGRVPTALDLLLFASLGFHGGLGHFLFTAAYRETSAPVLASLNYMQLVFAALLGWLVFAHVPDRFGLIGIALIITAGIIAALHNRRPPVKRSV
jgi:drug/metabolite transporter (DMT)-like permease